MEVKTAQERRVLRIALALNAAMAIIGGLADWIAQSTGLLADADIDLFGAIGQIH